NPAYAGYRGGTSINGIYRRQWTGFPGSPQTAALTADWLMPGRDDRVAMSARVMTDELGAEQTESFWLGYTYRLPMNSEDTKRLCFGLEVGVNQYSLDGSVFQYVDENDNYIPVGKVSKVKPDANFGVYYYTPTWYLSASVSSLFSVNETKFYNWNNQLVQTLRQSPHAYFGAGTLIRVNDFFKLKPTALWKEDFKGPSNFDFNLFAVLGDVVSVGASYRTSFNMWHKSNLQSDLEQQDAVSVIAEVYPTNWLRLGYAYDFTTSQLSNYQNGTHEISIGLLLPSKQRRAVSPRFF
ncbi:type IX secretion system membrane protein PorP/SprF, partial [Pedobacter sp. HMF7647]